MILGSGASPSRYHFLELHMSVVHELLRGLIFGDWGCTVVLLVMPVRLAFSEPQNCTNGAGCCR